MERKEKKECILDIPSSAIGLPSEGGCVTEKKLFHVGEMDGDWFSQMYHLEYKADAYRYRGVICPKDPEAPDIHFELGVPVNWNGKLIHMGGGGIDGYVIPCTMRMHAQLREDHTALEQGYVVINSDSGHEMNFKDPMDCSWAENEECFENYAYYALKKTKDAGTYILEQLYGKKPDRVYFYGGSNGGRECMKAIQNYASDYDGAVCVFPVLYYVKKVLKDIHIGKIYDELEEKGWIDADTALKIQDKIIEICGDENGLISDEKYADAKKAEIAGALKEFLTKEQMEMLEEIAAPWKMPYPLAYADEELPGYGVFRAVPVNDIMNGIKMGRTQGRISGSDSVLEHVFMKTPGYDARTFDMEAAKEQVMRVSKWMDADSTDIDAFKNDGGKIIFMHGMADPQVTSDGSRQYYKRLKERYGDELDQFARLYIAPGYGHGSMDGRFLAMADFLKMLDDWVEKDIAPEKITVTDYHPDHNQRKMELQPVRKDK